MSFSKDSIGQGEMTRLRHEIGPQLLTAPSDADVEDNREMKNVEDTDEVSRLKGLATDVRDQDDLERDIGRQADQLLTDQANERDQKRLEKTLADREKLQVQVRKLRERLTPPIESMKTARIQAEIAHLEAIIDVANKDAEQIAERIESRKTDEANRENGSMDDTANKRMPNESRRDFLIRTGKITPFTKIPGRPLLRSDSSLQGVLLDAEVGESEEDNSGNELQTKKNLSHRNLVQPGFVDFDDSETTPEPSAKPERLVKRRRLHDESVQRYPYYLTGEDDDVEARPSSIDHAIDVISNPEADDLEYTASSELDDNGGDGLDEDEINTGNNISRNRSKRLTKSGRTINHEDLTGVDDGNEKLYQDRIRSWVSRRSAARNKVTARTVSTDRTVETGLLKGSDDETAKADSIVTNMTKEEWHLPHPVTPDAIFDGGYRIPGDVYPSLFDYQKTGVQWLWELYSQQVGGIVGDEMGLGKTIQVIAFLAGLHYSQKVTRPIIILAPATVMKQWVNEFHAWWPPFRVSILHTSGSGMIDIRREVREEESLMSQTPTSARTRPMTKGHKTARKIVDRVIQDGHVLITTYSGLQTYAELLIPVEWEYAVLDEGHKIRNPNTAITIYCKELRTANRIILSGTPMQNNLIELWSLFDFVFPMRLGTLVNFRQQFEFPIRQGGYASASNLQVQTAMKCAETLKDTISPYLLQRFKADVASDLPKKSERVLFCRLTKLQRDTYENFLNSDDLKAIINGKRQVLYGVDILRKICNHPDLQDHKNLSKRADYNYGSGFKSGKMQVVKALLELWKDQGHKTLLFAQNRIMLDILERYIKSLPGYNIRRMDGNTPIQSRQGMVDEFNGNPNAHVFLLTTKVGGLGINLTGADRVIIYDPDWNPSTDVQARERAWRLGQKREVVIYRLMTVGTIEEKIYHRQLFKQFLTNKILRDPKQRQTFQLKDLHDLFTLGEANDTGTETSELFKGTEVRFESGNAAPDLGTTRDVQHESDQVPSVEAGTENVSSIRELTGIASVEEFNDGKEQHKPTGTDAIRSESRLLEGIFARSGVHSALEHDQIIDGKRAIVADPRIIEREAKKVAAEAAKELMKAGEVARTIPVGTPTWTGEFGTAGRPERQTAQRALSRGRCGPASLGILTGLRHRQDLSSSTNGLGSTTSIRGKPENTSLGPKGVDFMKLIRDYLVTHGGQVHTQMLIDHFNRYCNSPERTIGFKEMLKEIASLERGTRGRGKWVLKDKYR